MWHNNFSDIITFQPMKCLNEGRADVARLVPYDRMRGNELLHAKIFASIVFEACSYDTTGCPAEI